MRMKLTIVAALLVALAGAASAIQYSTTGPLEGSQEVTPPTNPGSGSATVLIDTDANSISVVGSYTGMSSDVTLAHLHGPAPRGVNAGVKIGLTPTGGTSGTIGGGGTYQESDEADILHGLWYVNVHTNNNPGGEIRGQVELDHAVGAPALSTWAIVALAATLCILAATIFVRRRQATV